MQLHLNIAVSGSSSGATLELTPFKYGKTRQACFEADDSAVTAITMYNKLKTAYFTDGCGNNKNYAMGLAVNGRNGFDNAEVGALPGTTMTYSERAALIPFGLDIMNHSFYHEPNGNYNNGTNAAKNIADLDAMILEKQKYKMNIVTVPTNYAGYMNAAAAAGYIGGNSQGTFDSFTSVPLYNPKGTLANLPVSNYQAILRGFSDDHSNNGYQWNLVNDMFTEGYNFFDTGTHGIYDSAAITNFNSWIDRIVQLSGDTLLFTSLREFLEYNHIRNYITKTQNISGNTINAVFDFDTVPNQRIRWYDLSMKVGGGKTITAVGAQEPGWNVTYNPDTGLINAQKQRTDWSVTETPQPSTNFKVSRRFRIG
jgi:hypothetical protein